MQWLLTVHSNQLRRLRCRACPWAHGWGRVCLKDPFLLALCERSERDRKTGSRAFQRGGHRVVRSSGGKGYKHLRPNSSAKAPLESGSGILTSHWPCSLTTLRARSRRGKKRHAREIREAVKGVDELQCNVVAWSGPSLRMWTEALVVAYAQSNGALVRQAPGFRDSRNTLRLPLRRSFHRKKPAGGRLRGSADKLSQGLWGAKGPGRLKRASEPGANKPASKPANRPENKPEN